MKKLRALYVNELSKMCRSSGIFIILALLVLVCIAPSIYLRVIAPEVSDPNWSGEIPLYYQKEMLIKHLSGIDEQLLSLDFSEESELRRPDLLEEKCMLEASVERIDFLQAAGYDSGGKAHDFIADASQKIISFRLAIRSIENISTKERTQAETGFLLFLRQSLDLIHAMPETRDFQSYINMCKEYLLFGNLIDFNEQAIVSIQSDLAVLERIYSVDSSGGIDGKYDYQASKKAIIQINAMEESLNKGYSLGSDETGENTILIPHTPDDRVWLQNSIIVAEHRLLTNSYPSDLRIPVVKDTQEATVFVGRFLITLLVLVTAGSTVSQEFATGSIKSLIIAPVRRWKILLAKLLSLISLLFSFLLMQSIFSYLAGAIMLGGDKYPDYIFAYHGAAVTIPYWIYGILCGLLDNVDLFVFSVFALMLSAVIRNTALSVGIPIAIFLAKDSITALLLDIFPRTYLWMNFVPFSNFDLKGDVFPYDIYRLPPAFQNDIGEVNPVHPGLLFSSVYLIVLVFCMLLITFDSFTRRDIK